MPEYLPRTGYNIPNAPLEESCGERFRSGTAAIIVLKGKIRTADPVFEDGAAEVSVEDWLIGASPLTLVVEFLWPEDCLDPEGSVC